jgi:uncharacterized protein YfaP (DUF2135 family)
MALVGAIIGGLALFSLPVFAQDALTITPGTPVTFSLGAESPTAVFTFEAAAASTYTVSATSDVPANLTIQVVDDQGLNAGGGAEGTPDDGYTLDVTVDRAGSYFIAITSLTSLIAEVDVEVTLTLAGPGGDSTPTADAATQATPAPASITPAADAGQLITTAGFQVALSWSGAADLDLEIRDPIGGSLYWETPTVLSGGSISANVNQGCAVVNADTPSETATWSPGGIPTGSYEVLVYYQQACPGAGDAPISFTIAGSLDGTALPPINGSLSPGAVFVTRFDIDAGGGVQSSPGGIVDVASLPYALADVQAAAQPIELESTISGFISNQQQFQSFTFEGQANQIISVSALATSGSLDTYAALLDAAGTVIAFNDDLAQGVTDSSINSVLLPAAGTYTVVVSRYGKDIGGTEGDFDLLVTQQTVNLSQEFLSLPEGSLEFLLLWNTNADLQLLVRDPAGDSVFDDIPRISSGGILGAVGNANCRVPTGTPFSYIYWPPERQPRPGVYEVEVWFQSECGDTSPVTFNLYVTLNGRQVLRATESPLGPRGLGTNNPIPGERYLTSFTVNADGSVALSDGGIITGVESLPYRDDIATATPLAPGEALAGTITQANKFDVFAYDGTANQSVTIALNATSGTLDTTLYVVSPSGQLVAENDDAVPGENTNSLIRDFILPEDGQYIIIVTHYGALYGGTTGTYTLTLTELG